MQKERYSREEFLAMFTEDVVRLSKYIPWLEEKSGADVSKNYQDGDKMAHTLSFPVYDSILLAFLNDASTTVFMEQNYHYFYGRNHIRDYTDELALIEKADIMHMDILQCILSKYVFGGMVKAYLWKDGVEHRIFVNILKKARQIVEFWSEPLVIVDEIPAEGYPEEFKYPEVDEADWTDEEFAAVLAGELNPDDIPRLRWEKEHGDEDADGVKEVRLPIGYEFPAVDDDDWTDEEFGAVLAGTLDPNDIPRLRYEKENNVTVVFVSEEELNAVAEADTAETGAEEVRLPIGYEFPAVDDEEWTDEEFGAVLAGTLDPNDIPRLRYEKENNVKVVFVSEEEQAETIAEEAEVVPEEAVAEETVEETISEEVVAEETVAEEAVVEEAVVEEAVVEEAVAEEAVVEEAVVEEAAVEEVVAEETVVEEAVVEEAVAEESAAEETVPEEPTAEETVVEEAVAEEAPKKKGTRRTKKAVDAAEESTEAPKKKRQRKQKQETE